MERWQEKYPWILRVKFSVHQRIGTIARDQILCKHIAKRLPEAQFNCCRIYAIKETS